MAHERRTLQQQMVIGRAIRVMSQRRPAGGIGAACLLAAAAVVRSRGCSR
ncbi:hypothetical protein MJ561_16830 [Klebsiella pneumoniae]|nr:hypothetical protein MJ561_16830 [Klebsiella pneumoniae]